MIESIILDKFLIPKARKLTKKMIIQKGPLLYDLEGLKKIQDLKLGIKKIILEQRPDSTSQTQRKSATLKQANFFLETLTPKHKQGNPSIFNRLIRFEENPFQNEALKFPSSIRSFSINRRIRRS